MSSKKKHLKTKSNNLPKAIPSAQQSANFITQLTHVKGPIPDPSTLDHYNKICPGAADRIITMAENQSKHRQTMEATEITGGISLMKRGQLCGLVVALAAITAATLCILNGYTIVGGILGGVPLLGLVSTFVYGRQKSTSKKDISNTSQN